jgi:hypothetical protein
MLKCCEHGSDLQISKKKRQENYSVSASLSRSHSKILLRSGKLQFVSNANVGQNRKMGGYFLFYKMRLGLRIVSCF